MESSETPLETGFIEKTPQGWAIVSSAQQKWPYPGQRVYNVLTHLRLLTSHLWVTLSEAWTYQGTYCNTEGLLIIKIVHVVIQALPKLWYSWILFVEVTRMTRCQVTSSQIVNHFVLNNPLQQIYDLTWKRGRRIIWNMSTVCITSVLLDVTCM